MSYFRAINQPWESPLESTTRERPVSDVVSGQRCETDGGQASALSPMQAVLVTPNLDEATQRDYPNVILPAKKLRVSPKKHPRLPMQSSTARAWAAVIPPEKQSCGQSKDKGDIGIAVAKAKRAMRTPGKKKRNSKSSKSKARRQQAPRQNKMMPSIEYSARKRVASYSSDCGSNGANESEYHPSPAELADTTHSSTASTPSRRNPRKHSSAYPSAKFSAISEPTLDIASLQPSPRASGTLAVINREEPTALQSMPNLEAVTPRPPSPSIWNSQLRRKKYEEADFVELPREIFEYFETKKEMRQLLASKKEVMRAGKRKEKGKLAEMRSVEETRESTQKTGKTKHEAEVEQNEPRKRLKSQESQKPGEADRSLIDDGKVFSEEPQTSKQPSARRTPKGKTAGTGVQRYKAVVVKAEDRSDVVDVRSHAGIEADVSRGSKNQELQRSLGSQVPEEPLGQAHDQASRHRKKQRVPLDEDWRKVYERREVSVPRNCSCALLPEYFTRNPSYVPRLATWGGGMLEFLEHVKQISCCRGSIHPPNVIGACSRMLRKYGYPNRGDERSLGSMEMFDFHGSLSGNDRNGDHPGRAQSSIPPPTFYGYRRSYRTPQHVGSSSRSAPTAGKIPRSLASLRGPERVPPPKDTHNKPVPRKTPMVHERVKDPTILSGPSIDQHPSSAVVDDAGSSPALPLSSPLGKRRRAVTPNHRVSDDSIHGQENVAARPISKGLPEPPSGPSEPRTCFGARRKRHQSAPVDSARRHNTINDHNPPPQPAPRRHEHALQAISNDAILHVMNRRVASLEKLLIERLPATPQTPTPAPPPAPAPPAPAPPQPRDAPPEPRRRHRKKPSRAQRQLKFPPLDRNVPAHLRLPDQGLIAVGRVPTPYERHARAPYAFGWGGRLYADYKHLLTRRGDGLAGWTAEEMYRLR